MNFKATHCSILAICAGLVAYMHLRNESPASEDPGRQSPSHSSRVPQEAPTPVSSFAFFKATPTLNLNEAPTFAQFEARAKHLTDEQLYTLLGELDPSSSLASWTRSALWAELGRRNHPDALSLLIQQAPDTGFSIEARDQSAFAFFRGRIESLQTFHDLRHHAIAQLNTFKDHKGTSDWRKPITRRLFKKMASLDPGATWNLVNQTNSPEFSDLPHSLRFTFGDIHSPFVGFFHGLDSPSLVQFYLNEWQPAVESESYLKTYNSYLNPNRPSHRSFRFYNPPPAEEALISHTLSSLARFQPDEAFDWIATHELNPEMPDQRRPTNMLKVMAGEHPDDAFSLLSDPAFAKHHLTIALELGKQDLSRAPELVESLVSELNNQGSFLSNLIPPAASQNMIDRYPDPERHNRIHNYQARHDHLLEAINASSIDEEKKEVYRTDLEKAFLNKLN